MYEHSVLFAIIWLTVFAPTVLIHVGIPFRHACNMHRPFETGSNKTITIKRSKHTQNLHMNTFMLGQQLFGGLAVVVSYCCFMEYGKHNNTVFIFNFPICSKTVWF